MEIVGSALSALKTGNSVASGQRQIMGPKPSYEDSNENRELKEKLKEAATEMLKEQRIMGEWKDKEGLDEILDPTLGGDIRYALTSDNIDFLKRLRWGNLTIGELREVIHRIRELELTKTRTSNIFSGNIINSKV